MKSEFFKYQDRDFCLKVSYFASEYLITILLPIVRNDFLHGLDLDFRDCVILEAMYCQVTFTSLLIH